MPTCEAHFVENCVLKQFFYSSQLSGPLYASKTATSAELQRHLLDELHNDGPVPTFDISSLRHTQR